MFELTIKKQGVVTNGPSPFKTRELAEAHVSKEEANKSYGETDKWVRDNEDISEHTETRKIIVSVGEPAKEAVTEEYVSKEAVLDEVTGDILEPAVISVRILEPAVEAIPEVSYLEYFIPKKYEVIIEDVTARVEQERVNAEALAYLTSTDWMAIREFEGGTAMPEDVKTARIAARASIIRS